MADGVRLERVCRETYRGFESHSLRFPFPVLEASSTTQARMSQNPRQPLTSLRIRVPQRKDIIVGLVGKLCFSIFKQGYSC